MFYSYKEAQKKMKAKYLFLVALLPLVANAWEPTPGYEKVSEGIDGTEYFLHKPSIKRKGDLVYFWVVEATPKLGLLGKGRTTLSTAKQTKQT